jgi:Ser/Thr protein kinase RdoA (MazF antagonist)
MTNDDDADAFMATMVVQSQPVPIERALALVREHYGLEGSALRLTGERDENFKLSAAYGAEYVLKIANSAEPPEVTDLPNAALLHVEKIDPTFPSPRVVRESSGGTCVRFKDGDGHERTARVLTYLPGKLLRMTAGSQHQRAACGRAGARLIAALRNFEHPAARRKIVWDVRHAAQVRRLLEQLPHLPCRQTAADLLARIVPVVESQLPSLRHQVVHNDLNPLNILVDPAVEDRVTGIIDFGDITYAALIGDVAVTAAELIPEDCTAKSGCARAAVLDVARAYHETLPLLRRELLVLGTLVAARLVAGVVVHEWHVHHNPGGGHHVALDPDFMRARLAIAEELLLEEFNP